MSIVITGAGGFIGTHLSKLIDTAVLISTKKLSLSNDQTIFNIRDFNDEIDWSPILLKGDQVIHLAGLAHKKYTRYDYKRVNVDGTLNLIKQAELLGVKRFVFVSSVSVHGSTNKKNRILRHDSNFSPENDFSESKVAIERALIERSKNSTMEIVIVRCPLVYGNGAPANFDMLMKLVRNFKLLPFKSFDNKRDFISVQNLSDLLVRCATHPQAGGKIFLASEFQPIAVRDFVDEIAQGLGKKVTLFSIPKKSFKIFGFAIRRNTAVQQLTSSLMVDSSDLKDHLGWTPPYTMKESMSFLSHTKQKVVK